MRFHESIYHQTVSWTAELDRIPMYMVAARQIGETDLNMRRVFAHVCRLLPRNERLHLYALAEYIHICGKVCQREMDDKIASGKMVWSDEWNTWIDKPEEPEP